MGQNVFFLKKPNKMLISSISLTVKVYNYNYINYYCILCSIFSV